MRKPLFTLATMLSGILAMAIATSLHAAELKVIAGGSMTASINAIAAAMANSRDASRVESTPVR